MCLSYDEKLISTHIFKKLTNKHDLWKNTQILNIRNLLEGKVKDKQEKIMQIIANHSHFSNFDKII